jgi:phenylalanyl-tRNA synthetase beta chain
MRERLRRSGLRPISPVVDVTNYILLELGQPMHAFDLGRLAGRIEVRMAVPGERLRLLGGQDLSLRADTLVIADAQGAVAMAGIMGGEDSGVGAGTRDILLESAFFAPLAIGGRARSYGLATDAAHRFERGVDPELQVPAIERATRLLLDIVGGTPGPVVEAVASDQLPQRSPVRLRRGRIRRVLGLEIDDDEVLDILRRLDMQVEPLEDGWLVTPPSCRFDIAIEVDLIEELGRIYGYTRIPMTHAIASTALQDRPETQFDLDRAKQLLVDRGYQEVVTYSFISPELQALVSPGQTPIALANPLSAEMSVMRTSLWPGLLLTAQHNLARQQGRVRIFESGLRFSRNGDDIDQTPMLAGLALGSLLPEQWGETARTVDFFDIKADVEALLALGGQGPEYRWLPAEHPALHPGQCARIERDGVAIGWLGMLHPELARRLDLSGDLFLFEIALPGIMNGVLPAFSPLSRYPSIRRDLALVLDQAISYQEVRACVQAAAPEILKDILVFDVYTGAKVDSGRKSLALGLILQDSLHTLTDQEGEEVMSAIRQRLSAELGATLRE